MDKYLFLNTSHRQNAQQQTFRDILDRISNGKVQIEDWRLLMTRAKNRLGFEEKKWFKNAVRLFAKNEDVNAYNYSKLKKLNSPVAKIEGEHNCEEAKKGSQQHASGLAPVLYLSIGSRIMLKTNIWTDKGLVNGALGYVRKIVYLPECYPPEHLPEILMIEFDNYTNPTIDNLVPISLVTRYWKSKSYNCSRKQFPVDLAWAITIHKSQGLTLDKAVIDLGDKERSLGLTYVALSRVKTLEGLIFNTSYNFKRFDNLKKSKLLEDRLKDELRMKNKT